MYINRRNTNPVWQLSKPMLLGPSPINLDPVRFVPTVNDLLRPLTYQSGPSLIDTATMYYKLRWPDRAQAALESFLETHQGNLEDITRAYNFLGLIHSDQEEHRQAIAKYSMAIGFSPDMAVLYYNRGLSHLALGNDDKACEDFHTSVLKEPGNVIFRHELIRSLEKKGDQRAVIQNARIALGRAQAAPNEIKSTLLEKQVKAHIRLKEFYRAVETLSVFNDIPEIINAPRINHLLLLCLEEISKTAGLEKMKILASLFPHTDIDRLLPDNERRKIPMDAHLLIPLAIEALCSSFGPHSNDLARDIVIDAVSKNGVQGIFRCIASIFNGDSDIAIIKLEPADLDSIFSILMRFETGQMNLPSVINYFKGALDKVNEDECYFGDNALSRYRKEKLGILIAHFEQVADEQMEAFVNDPFNMKNRLREMGFSRN